MKADFKSGIKKTKTGIIKTIKMLDSDADFESANTKTILKSRKEAFITAAQMTIGLHEMEVEELVSKVDSDWYKKTITLLIEKGQSEIDTMFDGIAQDVKVAANGDYSAEVKAKNEAFADVRTMREEVKKLEQIMAENTSNASFDIGSSTVNDCLRHAE